MLKRQISVAPLKRHWFSRCVRQNSAAAAAAKSLQSCPTLCDPMDCSLPGFSVHGIFQARTLEWVAISFSNAWKWKVKVKSFSRVWLLATPWTAAYQAPPSMGFSGQQYLSGVPLPSPRQNSNLLPPPKISISCLFNQTLIEVLLWRYFADIIKVSSGYTLKFGDYLVGSTLIIWAL